MRDKRTILEAHESLATEAGDSAEMQIAADVLAWVLGERKQFGHAWMDGYLLDDPDTQQPPLAASEN